VDFEKVNIYKPSVGPLDHMQNVKLILAKLT